MFLRSLPLTGPATVALAVMLAFAGPAVALDADFDDMPEIAQAAPPPPPTPPHAGRAISPKAMCLDMTARRIGDRAYLKARLELKPEQMAAWTAFEKAADEASARESARCATLPAEMKDMPNVVDRMTMREDMMKARLASMQSVKPALQALYAVLTPEQKTIIDRPMHGPMMGGPMMGGPMMGGRMGRMGGGPN